MPTDHLHFQHWALDNNPRYRRSHCGMSSDFVGPILHLTLAPQLNTMPNTFYYMGIFVMRDRCE